MAMQYNTTMKYYTLALAALLGCSLEGWQVLSAQNKKEFTDIYGLKGRITFAGEWADEHLPESGPYRLQWREVNFDTLQTYSVAGRIRSYLPHGAWTWDEARWEYSIEPDQGGLAPVFQTEGTQRSWKGSFDKGTAQGKWSYALGDAPLQSSFINAPLRIDAELRQGRMVNKFSVTDRRTPSNIEITGYCDALGVADKTWTFRYIQDSLPVLAKLTYHSGILIQRSLKLGDSEAITLTFSDRIDILAADGGNEAEVGIGPHEFQVDELSGRPGEMLAYYMNEHFLQGWELEQFAFEPRRLAPVFKKLQYRLSATDSAYRDTAQMRITDLRQAIEERFEGRNLEIKRARSAELDLSIAVLQRALQLADSMEQILVYSREPLFTYQNRNAGALSHYFDSLKVQGMAQGEVYEEATDSLFDDEAQAVRSSFFGQLDAMSAKLERKVKVYLPQLDKIFAEMRKEGELRDLEALMESRLTGLDSLYAPLEGLGRQVGDTWVNGYLSAEVRAYAKIDDYQEAMATASALLARMDSLIAWSGQWKEIDNTTRDLEEGYKYFAYNPYTGDRDIELSVKSRFRRQVQEVLLPYIEGELKTAETWDEFEALRATSAQLRKELLRFAFMDERADQRLERRLRRENQPERLLRQFLGYMEGR